MYCCSHVIHLVYVYDVNYVNDAWCIKNILVSALHACILFCLSTRTAVCPDNVTT